MSSSDLGDSINPDATAASWGCYNRLIRGNPYSFVDFNNPHRHRPFLALPLTMQPKVKGYKKSRQAGVSESSVTEALWMLSKWPVNVVYTFPAPKQVEDFSNIRVKEALTKSRGNRLAKLMGDPQNVTLRKIGKGALYLRSATNPKLGEGIDADVVVFDEIDRMKRGVGIAFKESLSASKYGFQREVSTPTLPGRGIDELWQKSNQAYWFVKCPACGHEQSLKYPDNILELCKLSPHEKIVPEGTYAFCCAKCKSTKIDRWRGRWVAAYPSRTDYVCFHVNQPMCVWISADEIMQKKRDYRFPQLFWNYVLGETYASDNILVNDHALDICTDMELKEQIVRDNSKYSYISVGIDWGSFNWCAIWGLRADGGGKDLLALKVSEDSDEPLGSTKALEDFIRPFKPDIIVGDWGYGKDRVTYLVKRFPGRVYGCTYADESRMVKPNFSVERSTVSVDRTGWLKTMANEFRERKVRIPGEDALPLIHTFRSHLKALVVMREEQEDGTIRERVDETGDDHFAHATGYGLIGFEYLHQKGGSGFSFDFV